MLVKVLHSICQQIWKTQQWPQDWKRSIFIPIPKKGNAKECSNYRTIALTSHGGKVMLRILQVRLPTVRERRTFECSSYTCKRQRNQRSNCQHPLDHQKSKRVPEKHLFLLYWLHQSPWLCGSQQTGKFIKRWEYQTTLLPPEKSVCRSRSNSWNWTCNNRPVPKRERSMSRLYIVTLLI